MMIHVSETTYAELTARDLGYTFTARGQVEIKVGGARITLYWLLGCINITPAGCRTLIALPLGRSVNIILLSISRRAHTTRNLFIVSTVKRLIIIFLCYVIIYVYALLFS